MFAQSLLPTKLPQYWNDFWTTMLDRVWNIFTVHSEWNERFMVLIGVLGLIVLVWLVFTVIASIFMKTKQVRFLGFFFWYTLIYGILVYDIGMYANDGLSLLTNLPLAVLNSFKAFLLDSDVSLIQNDFHGNILFFTNFVIVHCSAALVTAIFVIKHFGYNIVMRIKRFFARSCFGSKVEDFYVLWGLNDASYNLANSINEHYNDENNKEHRSYKMIVVRTGHDEDEDSQSGGSVWNRIFDFLMIKNSDLERLQHLRCLSVSTHENIASVKVPKSPSNIFRELRLTSLRKLLTRKTTGRIHLFFLSDDEHENIHAVSLLQADERLQKFTQTDNREVIFYCHARKSSAHRVIEYKDTQSNMPVKVVDSSHLLIELLKCDENNPIQPVHFVDIEADATVSSPFNSLIIGFSEVGRDAARFVYEFGAFVKTGSSDQKVERSDFKLHIVDNRMDDIAGPFVANAQAINISLPFMPEGEITDAPITLHKMDCLSVEFHNKLNEWIKTLNYVVIATENDELNISVGVRILKLAMKHKRDISKLCILVRAKKNFDHVVEIARYYNRICLAQNKIKNYDGKAHQQKSVTNNFESKLPIYLFGVENETYTYDNIVSDKLLNTAKHYKNRYELAAENKTDDIDYLEKDRRIYLNLTGEYKGYSPTYCGIISLKRKRYQDFANSLHELTKKKLANVAISKIGVPPVDWKSVVRKYEQVEYTLANGEEIEPRIKAILKTLARTEHMRWNASHEINGYVTLQVANNDELGKRDEVTMELSCLTDWQNLTDKYRSFDHNVVDLSLGIIDEKNPISK